MIDLKTAISMADYDGIRTCIEAGVAPDATTEGRPLIHHAATRLNPKAVEMLVEAGAEVDARNADEMTTFHWLILMRPKHDSDCTLPEMVTHLFHLGANLEALNNEGRTPLHEAVRHGLDDVVRCLIEHGANLEARMPDGSTALTFACEPLFGPRPDILEILLEAGSDVHSQDEDGTTILHCLASTWKRSRERVAGMRACLEKLLCAGADPNAVNRSGVTPLTRAARQGQLELAQRLVEAGAVVNPDSDPNLCLPKTSYARE